MRARSGASRDMQRDPQEAAQCPAMARRPRPTATRTHWRATADWPAHIDESQPAAAKGEQTARDLRPSRSSRQVSGGRPPRPPRARHPARPPRQFRPIEPETGRPGNWSSVHQLLAALSGLPAKDGSYGVNYHPMSPMIGLHGNCVPSRHGPPGLESLDHWSAQELPRDEQSTDGGLAELPCSCRRSFTWAG